MCFIRVIVAVLLTGGLSRIVEPRDSKMDTLALDKIVAQIVESSMDDMRFRLRQTIYTVALKKSDTGQIDHNENWLFNHFITQITEKFLNESLAAERTHRAKALVMHKKEMDPRDPVVKDLQGFHKLMIPLETYTIEPHKEFTAKLITASNFRMPDSANFSKEKPGEKARLFFFRIPLWQLLLSIIPSVIFLLLITLSLILWFRVRRAKRSFLKKMSNPYVVSGAHTLTDASNTPQSFFEYLDRQKQMGTMVREREHCEVWIRTPTVSTSLEPLRRV